MSRGLIMSGAMPPSSVQPLMGAVPHWLATQVRSRQGSLGNAQSVAVVQQPLTPVLPVNLQRLVVALQALGTWQLLAATQSVSVLQHGDGPDATKPQLVDALHAGVWHESPAGQAVHDVAPQLLTLPLLTQAPLQMWNVASHEPATQVCVDVSQVTVPLGIAAQSLAVQQPLVHTSAPGVAPAHKFWPPPQTQRLLAVSQVEPPPQSVLPLQQPAPPVLVTPQTPADEQVADWQPLATVHSAALQQPLVGTQVAPHDLSPAGHTQLPSLQTLPPLQSELTQQALPLTQPTVGQ